MFNRLTNFLAQAAEVTTQVLVGQQSKEEEFIGHWKTVTTLISSEEDSESESCTSEVYTHLERMADLLFHEEEEDKNLSMGACMEFMIRHKLLDTLCATAKSDFPLGMRKNVFHFLSLLLGRIQQPLLPHIAIHRPLNKLIKTCGQSFNNPLAVNEIQFLRTLCLMLQSDSTLSNFFLEEEKANNSKKDSIATSFTIAEALMRITNSEDSLICLKAFECLLLCMSLPTISKVMSQSQFPLLIASKMRQHLQLLPTTLDCADALNCKGGWGVNYASSAAIQCLSPSPQQPFLHLEAYLSWLDYCEQVISVSPMVLQDSVCECIKEQVLDVVILPKLLAHSSEVDLVMGLTLLTVNLLSITHEKLTKLFINFILTRIRNQLILSCNHLSEEVCCASFLLLHTLIQRPSLPQLIPSYKEDTAASTVITKDYIEHSVKSYLNIIPANLLSAHEVSGDSGITYYLLEAHQQVSACQQLATQWEESPPPTITDNNHSSLITGLLDRLERLLDQTYELNLHLTSVLTCLASYPQMESLFTIPSLEKREEENTRNIYTVLQKVSEQLQSHAERTPGIQFNIVEARRRLLGQETSDLLSMPNNELLEGAVILEEFCKEIAATLYVRHSTVLINSRKDL